MPELTEKPSDKKPTREDVQKGIIGNPFPQTALRSWTVLQIIQALKKNRNVVAVFTDDPTAKIKYGRKLQRLAVAELGEPLDTLGGGQWPNEIQWKGGTALALAIQSPEDTFRGTPRFTDVVNVIIPKDWIDS